MPQPPPSLKGRALRLLSGREHSRAELERKLKAHAPEPGLLAGALDELQAKGFIDEKRVSESVLHRRSDKLGAARIRQELQRKGLDPDAVANAVATLQVSEVERAHAVWRKKFGAAAAISASERGRQMRFLASRGFSSDAIRRVVAATVDDQDPVQD
ncbi:MAG: recombination regulator RecX [Burkholderiaceae bacterium]